MQPAKRVAINTGFLYARMFITVFISLYATRLILAALGAADFGLFSVVGGAIAMLTFLNNAMATASQRFMSFAQGEGNHEKQINIFNVSVVLHIIVGLMVVALLEIAGLFLFNGILNIPEDRVQVAKLIYQFMLVSTFFTIISVPYDAVINAHENMLLVAILGIVEALLKLGIAIYITQVSYDKLTVYGALTALLSIGLLIIRRIYCHKKYSEVIIDVKKYFDKPLFKEMTHFASWSFLGSATSMITNYGQGIVINMFFGTIINAAQGVASQVRGQMGAFSTTMLKALNPVISKSEGAGNRNLMLKASLVGSKISFFLLMLLYIPVFIEMPAIFKFWLKSVPEYAILFCKLGMIRDLVEQTYLTLVSSISAVGNIRKYQIYSSLLTSLPLIISFILFEFGFPAYILYVVFIIYAILQGGLVFWFAVANCGLSLKAYLDQVLFRCFAAFAITFAVSLIPTFFLNDGLYRIALILITSTLSFGLTFWFIGLTRSEKENLLGLFFSRTKTKKLVTER